MADDEQFSLCWNNFNTNLSAGFHESLLRGDLVDVTLAAEGQFVKAHRLILSVCSPYFRKMLTQVPVTQHAFIFLKDVSHSALKDLIQFMYCGEVNVKQDALPAFISTAEALQIKGLTETGDSAPVQQSPAKEVIAAPPATINVPIAPATGGSPRTKVQRTRVHSYKLESEESGDDKVQIQAGSSHHVTAQQVQQQTHHTTTQKRTLQQRTVIPIQPSKRTKLSVTSVEALEAPEATPQVQTVQIVKQVMEPDYVEIPIESINAKAEPEYADETGEIETVETEAEQEHTLTEHEQSAEQEQADEDGNYVEDDYGEMGKFEESYFTEGEDAKAGASGFGDSYTSDGGTGTEQSAQENTTLRPKAEETISNNSKITDSKPTAANTVKVSNRTKMIEKVPLHAGSSVYISTVDLLSIYTPKPALYTTRLIELTFGVETLRNSCLDSSEAAEGSSLVPLDATKLDAVLTHVVHVFQQQNQKITRGMVENYIRNRLDNLQKKRAVRMRREK